MLVNVVPWVKCVSYGEVGYASNWFHPKEITVMDAWLEVRKTILMAEQNHMMTIQNFSRP